MLYDYFQSYQDYFWQWEEEMDVVAIPEASTIVYREYVLQILNKLSPQGLPPFGSLLLALIATNPDARSSINAVYSIVGSAIKTADNSTLAESIAFLNLLSEVPSAFKTGKKRVLLLQVLFQDCHYISSVKNSARILETYISGNYGKGVVTAKKLLSHERFNYDFRTIALLSKKFPDVDAILDRMAALPDIPEEIFLEKDNTAPEPINDDFVQQLIDHSQTFPVGSLIERIWSALNIPFHNTLPSQQPLGGVSDLTNKGEFDKLLISEFAHDDLVFLSRLANNEALYLRREIPPANNNLQRLILIDVSLRNWGTPRTIALAITLAIARHPKTDISCLAYVVGNNYHSVTLDTPEAVIDALQVLEGSPHAAKGLEQFFKENALPKNQEVIFISAADATKLTATQMVLDKYHAFFSYWIQTSSHGQVAVYKKQHKGKKHVQSFLLPLQELWKKQITIFPEKPEMKQPSLLPILLPMPVKAKKVLGTSDGEIFQITHEKNLLRLYDRSAGVKEKGWELVYEHLPFTSAEFELALHPNGAYLLFIYSHDKQEILLLNITTGGQKTIPFQEWKSSTYKTFFFDKEHFYYLSFTKYWAIGLDGTITSFNTTKPTLLNALNKRQVYLESLLKEPMYKPNILKNIKQVYINESGNLVFNTLELNIYNGFIKLIRTFFLDKRHEAYRSAKNEFSFPEGSKVEVKRDGIAILKSSNPDIPYIYIPLAIENALGLATDNAFAGNDYYLKEPAVDVELISPGRQVITAINLLKKVTGIGTAEAKKIIDGAPGSFLKRISQQKAIELKRSLEKDGGQVMLHNVTSFTASGDFAQLLPENFYQKYVLTFIETIKGHGTRN